MHGLRIPIWFFIGVLLTIYGGMITGYGVYEWLTASYAPGVQLTYLHAPVWWGGLLGIIGIFYLVKFWPAKATHKNTGESKGTGAPIS